MTLINLTSEIRNLDSARREYQAAQLLLQKRYSNNWQLLGSYTWSETKGNVFDNDGFRDYADFPGISDEGFANRFGLAPYDREHQFKVFGNYQIPLERVNFSIGTAIRYESGIPFQQETFGDFTRTRFVTPRGSQRLPELFQWDLSFGADFKVGKEIVVEVKTEVFNVTDEQQQIGVDTLVFFDQNGQRVPDNFGRPETIFDLQTPRSYRLTLGLRF